MIYASTIKMPRVPHTVTALSDGKGIFSVVFDMDNDYRPDEISDMAVRQFSEYFAGKRQYFNVPVADIPSSEFFKKVLSGIKKVPYGKTQSYKDLAYGIGCKGIRAVASQLKYNPCPLLIPCHRIVPAGGGFGHYCKGEYDDIKEYLIRLERGEYLD